MRLQTTLALMPLALCILAAAPPPKAQPGPADDAPQPVSVAVSPGPARDAARKLLLAAYAQATATVLGEPAWDGSAGALHALQAAHQADLALLDGPTLAASCRAQVIDKLDWTAIGRDRFLPGAASDCGAGAYLSAVVLAWDADKLAGVAAPDKPSGSPGWGDFWDVAKHPGRRGLRRAARGNLEIALLADGVAASDIYRTLRSSDGVDRAFRKLDQLKPYIIWWDQPAQPGQLLAAAKVLLTSAPAASLVGVPKVHIGTQWAGSLSEVTSWAMPSGSAHPRGAAAALMVATDAARQADFSRASGLGPSTRAAFALLPQVARPQNPSLPANLQAGLAIDEGFWLDNADKLEARFAAWVAK